MRNRIGNRSGRRVALGALLATLLVWGCDGNNLFGPGVGLGPQIITLETPSAVPSGEEMQVRVRAVGLVRVDSIVTTARGGEFNFRRVSLSQNGETDLTVGVSFDIPRPITDTLVVVQATAYDAQGNPSLPKLDTVRALDTTPPSVQTTVGSQQVGQGKTLAIGVQATDNIGMNRIGYRVFNADSVVVASDSAAISGREASRSFQYDVPLDLPLGAYRVEGFARDLEGNRGAAFQSGSVEVIFIDEERPVVQIQLPGANQNVAVGDTLRVRARMTDNDAIDSVRVQGVAFRGDPDLGTFQVVPRFAEWNIKIQNPTSDTTLTRILQPTPDSTAEAARVIVTAWDRQGNFGADTVVVQLRADQDPPTVQIFNPTLGAALPKGDSILVQANIADPNGLVRSGVRRVRFEGVAFRGDQSLGTFAAVPRFIPREVTLDPPVVQSQAISRFLVPTADTTTENVHFIVTAIDGWGNVAADTVMASLTGEGTLPTITILDPGPGAGMPTGDSIFVRARLQSPEGIASVTYDGVAHRGDRDLGTHVEVQRYTPRTVNFNPPVGDTLLARFLTATSVTTSEEVYIRVIATDGRGQVERDSVLVTVGGPRVELPDLLPTQNVSVGQQVQIRVTANDPTGVEQVVLDIEEPAGAPAAVTTPVSPVNLTPAQTSVTIDFTWDVPPGASGTYTVRARARNTNGIFGAAPTVQLVATTSGTTDTTPPTVRIIPEFLGSSFDPARMEVTDSIRLNVTGQDNPGGSGVVQAGYAVRIVPRSRPTDTLFVGNTFTRGAPASGVWTHPFTFTVEEMVAGNPAILDLLNAPDTLDLDIFGWMRDNATPTQNCGATVSATTPQSLVCIPGPNGTTLADGQTGMRRTISVVIGQTVRLPAGGAIADAVVDPNPARGHLFLSNIALGRLEVFNLNTLTFTGTVQVGAQPWGMTFGLQDPNILYVANSGGTNISVVDVPPGGGPPSENLPARILTPNTLLMDVREVAGSAGLAFETTLFDFSDRPQFIAQDDDGRLVYSTRPTGAAPDGTIRVADFFGGTTEVYLFTDHGRTVQADGTFALGSVDQFTVPSFSQPPGYGPVASRRAPHAAGMIRSDTIPAAAGATPTAVNNLRGRVQTHVDAINYRGVGAAGYPPIFLPLAQSGRWDIPSVGLSDTTFIAASGDGSVVAIGEGATAPTGRILLWRADGADPRVSALTQVIDLVGNASERVLGVDMNHDGSMGVGRGMLETYFFDQDLRLQGTVPILPGGTGVALHPLHVDGPVATPPDVALAFVPVGGGRVEVINTLNFNRIGRAYIRDNIVGPLRATLPYPADNTGLTCPMAVVPGTGGGQAVQVFSPATDDACVVTKLSGISADGGVVVINIRKRDVIRDL